MTESCSIRIRILAQCLDLIYNVREESANEERTYQAHSNIIINTLNVVVVAASVLLNWFENNNYLLLKCFHRHWQIKLVSNCGGNEFLSRSSATKFAAQSFFHSFS